MRTQPTHICTLLPTAAAQQAGPEAPGLPAGIQWLPGPRGALGHRRAIAARRAAALWRRAAAVRAVRGPRRGGHQDDRQHPLCLQHRDAPPQL